MEVLLIKPLGHLLVVGLPAFLLLKLFPESIQAILTTELWADPDQ